MEEALNARLRGAPPIAALVDQRIYWIERPQGSGLPALTLQRITSGRIYTHSGASRTSNPLVQADCWGRTYAEAKALARAVIAEMEQRRTVAGLRFAPAFLEGDRDMPPEELGAVKVYRVSLDFRTWNSPA